MTERPHSIPLYEQVIRITHVYFGPAAERFIARQVNNHLHKAPEMLNADDLANLIDWIHLAVSMITDNTEIVEEYTSQLRKLARPMPSKTKGEH